MAVMGELAAGGAFVLREEVVDDVLATVNLLARDQLGATRDGIASEPCHTPPCTTFHDRGTGNHLLQRIGGGGSRIVRLDSQQRLGSGLHPFHYLAGWTASAAKEQRITPL